MMAEAATFPELTRFYYDEVVTRGHRLMASVIERGVKNGEFRPVNVMVAAKLAMAPLMHAAVVRRAFASCMPGASTCRTTSTPISTSISMALRNSKRWSVAHFVCLATTPLAAQVAAPLRLSFADVV